MITTRTTRERITFSVWGHFPGPKRMEKNGKEWKMECDEKEDV